MLKGLEFPSDRFPIFIRGAFQKHLSELLNLRALNFHLWIKSTSFNVWVRYFVWNFKGTLWNSTLNILPIHWKMWFLYDLEILRALRFKSSYPFLKCPPAALWCWFGNLSLSQPPCRPICLPLGLCNQWSLRNGGNTHLSCELTIHSGLRNPNLF